MLWSIVLTSLIVAALLVRVVHLDQSLLTFHPTRQYRSAIIARACYYDSAPEIPDWARSVAAANRAMQPEGEPPVMEWLACAGYRLLGAEHLAIGRGLAIIFWVLGAIPLAAVIRRFAFPQSALVGVSVFLFLPYGIVASRALQPDALMTCCALWAILTLVRHHERPTIPRMLLAASGVAVAALVKPMSVFLTLPAAFGLSVSRHGLMGTLRRARVWGLLTLSVLPPALYYGYRAVFGGLAQDQMHLRFVPALLGSRFFWGGWWTQIERVFGVPVFVAGVAGTVFVARGPYRTLLVALWAGYALFAVAFTYHMATHDYYHLPYIAVIAFGAAALFGVLERWLRPRLGARVVRGLAAVTTIAIAIVGPAAAWPRLEVTDAAERVERYMQIGELTRHSARVVFLDSEYGYPLMYHGEVSGDFWPNTDDLAAEAFGGIPLVDAETRFARDYADVGATHFVVTDLASLAAQPDLAQWLATHATPVRTTETDRVYELRATTRRGSSP
jgi:hypothetical protein